MVVVLVHLGGAPGPAVPGAGAGAEAVAGALVVAGNLALCNSPTSVAGAVPGGFALSNSPMSVSGAVAGAEAVAVVVAVAGDLALSNSPISSSLKVSRFQVEKISSSPEATSNSLIEAEVGEGGGANDGDNIRSRQVREHHEVPRIQLLKNINMT